MNHFIKIIFTITPLLFKTISKFVARFHFFSEKITDQDFVENAIISVDTKRHNQIWMSYLGYVTIRPVGATPFGVMILKPYPYVKGLRERFMNSAVDNYRFDVFGKKIQMSTLSFQQEDKVVGVCATFAIWSAFHKLSSFYKMSRPSPYEITEKAGLSPHDTSRLFPSPEGLDPHQIVSVFEKSNLTLEKFSFKTRSWSAYEFKELVYAYNRCGIPLLLTYNYVNGGNAHLVAIAGYRLKNQAKESVVSQNKNNGYPNLLGSSIMRIFSHNDSFGPYARIDFKETSGGVPFSLKTFQIVDDMDFKEVVPTTLWIPLEHMVKINFEDVKIAINKYDWLIKEMQIFPNPSYLLWDIYFTKAVDYKQSFSKKYVGIEKHVDVIKRIKTTSYPKYIWVASLEYKSEGTLFNLVFDASALPNDNCLFQINYFNSKFQSSFEAITRKINHYLKGVDDDKVKIKYPNFTPYTNYGK